VSGSGEGIKCQSIKMSLPSQRHWPLDVCNGARSPKARPPHHREEIIKKGREEMTKSKNKFGPPTSNKNVIPQKQYSAS